jgi:TPR repeat protein
MVGNCYNDGIAVNKESKIAIYWYEKAANNGNLLAMRSLVMSMRTELVLK